VATVRRSSQPGLALARRGFNEDEVWKILGLSYFRFFREIQTEPRESIGDVAASSAMM